MSQQDAVKQQANTRNNIRIVSIFTAAAIGIVGVLVILYAWQLPPFTRESQFTDNAYVRGQTTFISPQVNGYITEVKVQDFNQVKAGDVLFQIDDRIYKQRVHQAEAQLAMKEAALKNNQQQRKSAEAVITRNEAALQNARAQNLKTQADLKRVQELTADGSLSIRERDSARASAAQGTADIEQAKATLEMSRQDLQSTIVNRDSLLADVANAKAALELAQIDLQNTRIIAPTDGQLGQISVRLGAYVTAGTHLTSLVPPQHWLIANLKETQLAQVRVGQPVTFTVDALNSEKFTGTVQSISPATGVEFSAISPDNATGNFVKIAQRIPVRIAVDEGQKNGTSACGRACRCRSPSIPARRSSNDPSARSRRYACAGTGCQSADVQRAAPGLQIPAAWRADVGPSSPVEGVWWRNFHDSTLNLYVDQALRYNSDVLIARERVNEYQARAYAADSSLFPSLDAGLTGTRARSQSTATGLPVHSTVYKGALTASYDVDLWGVNRSAASAAQASLEAQKAAAAAANLTVASSVAVRLYHPALAG